MLKVLFLCTENACRSQMAEGLVNHYLAGKVRAYSAGVRPSKVNPRAIRVMAELGIDISKQWSKSVEDFKDLLFDLVITVCDQAQEECPFFPGPTEKLHMGFPDQAKATGRERDILRVFRQVRDDMRKQLLPLLEEKITPKKIGANLGFAPVPSN